MRTIVCTATLMALLPQLPGATVGFYQLTATNREFDGVNYSNPSPNTTGFVSANSATNVVLNEFGTDSFASPPVTLRTATARASYNSSGSVRLYAEARSHGHDDLFIDTSPFAEARVQLQSTYTPTSAGLSGTSGFHNLTYQLTGALSFGISPFFGEDPDGSMVASWDVQFSDITNPSNPSAYTQTVGGVRTVTVQEDPTFGVIPVTSFSGTGLAATVTFAIPIVYGQSITIQKDFVATGLISSQASIGSYAASDLGSTFQLIGSQFTADDGSGGQAVVNPNDVSAMSGSVDFANPDLSAAPFLDTSPLPEPQSIMLGLLGLLSMIGRRSRRV